MGRCGRSLPGRKLEVCSNRNGVDHVLSGTGSTPFLFLWISSLPPAAG